MIYQNINPQDQKADQVQFLSTKIGILKLFGILLDGRDKKNAQNYVLKHINGGVIQSTAQLHNEDRVMILLRESLMQSSGSITPATSKDGSLKNNLAGTQGVVKGSDGQKIDFRGMQKENFIKDQLQKGTFDGLNKHFKEEELPADQIPRHRGVPGLLGNSIALTKKANKRKEKLERK